MDKKIAIGLSITPVCVSCMMGVTAMYTQFLHDKHLFRRGFLEHVNRKEHDLSGRNCREDIVTLDGLSLIIEFAFEMMRDVGLHAVYDVYSSIRQRPIMDFCIIHGTHKCIFSGLVSEACIEVNENLKVHKYYRRWLQCLWLVTHIGEVERQRKVQEPNVSIPDEHIDVYREAFIFVVNRMENLHSDIAERVR